MAASITIQTGGKFVVGNKLTRLGTGNLGNPYAAGGIAVTAGNFALSVIEDLQVMPAGGYVFEFDKANSKIKAYLNKDPAAAGGADLALPEAGAIDLSGVTFRFQVWGH